MRGCFDFPKKDDNYQNISLVRKCSWKKIKPDETPGVVISSIHSRNGTLKRILPGDKEKVDALVQYSLCLAGKKRSINVADIWSILSSDDQENILGLYLQTEKKLLVYPKTARHDMSAIEYMLTDKDGNHAVVQCKLGDKYLEEEEVKALAKEYDQVYISQGRAPDKLPKPYRLPKNVEFVSLEDLEKYAKKGKNLKFMPKRIQHIIERFAPK
jgi:hypothetical protein